MGRMNIVRFRRYRPCDQLRVALDCCRGPEVCFTPNIRHRLIVRHVSFGPLGDIGSWLYNALLAGSLNDRVFP